jgi:hypothetical protein
VESSALTASWIGPALAVAFGGALWAFGARFARQAVMLMGFAGGVPAGAGVANLLGLAWFPPVLGAIAGALIGLVIARLAYRLMLAVGVSVAAAMLGAILATALVDQGVLAEESRRASVAMQARTQELTETVTRELAANEDTASAAEAVRGSLEQLWKSLESPERTLVIATTSTSWLVGFLLGLFIPRAAEIAATSLLGSIFIAWGLGHALGDTGPSPGAWGLSTLVLTAVGVTVQALTRGGARTPAPTTSPPAAA